jgi:hypothetical protein
MVELDVCVQKFIELRGKRDKLRVIYDHADKALKEQQEEIENVILEWMETNGVQNVKTAYGTAYVVTNISATVEDRLAFLQFVVDNDRLDLLDARCNKAVARDYLEETQHFPPGVSISKVRKVNFRK